MNPTSPMYRLARKGAKASATVMATLGAGLAHAQSGGGPFGALGGSLCWVLKQFTGPNSTLLSLVFLVVLAVFLLLWWMNESKEGPMLWFIRTGMVIAVLINIFSLPPLLGMAPVSC